MLLSSGKANNVQSITRSNGFVNAPAIIAQILRALFGRLDNL